MSRRSRKQPSPNSEEIQRLVAAEVERRLSQMTLPPGAKIRPINQDALMAQMMAQQAPAKDGTPMFAPGAPLQPATGLSVHGMPRGYAYNVGYNIQAAPRSTEDAPFSTLRNLVALYDGAQLCEQVWLDTVAKLTLKIKVRDEIIAEQGKAVSATKYADKIRQYSDFFAMPDPGNGYDLKSWLRAAVRDQLQIDAVAIYVRRNRAGGVYALELVDGATIKPLIDPRGRRPQPPYPAYQQYLYGVPAGLYTSEEMLYQRETTRTESIYGLSRAERIIVRINQALRKENKDLARFTDGNIPPGILTPPDDGSQWTPDQLLAYQDMWDALLAGNDQARSRIKVIQPGSSITSLQDQDIFVDFDRFLLNVTAACYSMTMADLGFTESVNKSSGESQENVFYRRAVQPLMDRYATLFTFVLRHYFNEQDLVVAWSGFEESEDFNASAASYVSLVNTGIVSPTTAAHLMNLPWSGVDIPNYVLTKDGITFLEDAADPKTRKALGDAKVASAQLAAQPPSPKNTQDDAPTDDSAETPDTDAQATQSDGTPHNPTGAVGKTTTPRQSGAKGDASKQAKPPGSVEKGDTSTEEIQRHLLGKHDQQSHAHGVGASDSPIAGKSLAETSAYLSEHGGNQWASSLSHDEYLGVLAYTSKYYAPMNGALRANEYGYPGSPPREVIDKLNRDATSALMRSHAPCDMMVTRNVKRTRFAAFQANVGKHFVDRGFCSTTIQAGGAENYGGMTMHIKVNKGTPGAYLNNISQHSTDHEWLLPPNAKFKIIKAYQDNSGANHVDMEYVGIHQW